MARAQSMSKNAQRKRLAKQVKGGSSPISGMGAVVRKAAQTRNGPKASESDHLQPQLFKGGKHRDTSVSASIGSGRKDLAMGEGSPSVGKHSKESSKARHASGAPSVSSSGLSYVGRHRRG